jgi:fructose-bisphosphate aldolase class I
MVNQAQAQRMTSGTGFIAALDQSGGSTPRALAAYGIDPSAYSTEAEMFDLIHEMRTRIVMSPAFGGDRVLAAILFEETMNREFGGAPAAHYLWHDKGVVPFLKIDKGLADSADGVQLMKPIPGLDPLLDSAVQHGIFGTKERSVIGEADATGIAAVVEQQFELAQQVLSHGLIPILEPEVTITIPDKADAEALLLDELTTHLDAVPEGQHVMVKLSLPTVTNFYRALTEHPRVMRVVALSGGYSRAEADALLADDIGEIASFSRALTEGLSAQQSDEEFDAALDRAVQAIYDASVAPLPS